MTEKKIGEKNYGSLSVSNKKNGNDRIKRISESIKRVVKSKTGVKKT